MMEILARDDNLTFLADTVNSISYSVGHLIKSFGSYSVRVQQHFLTPRVYRITQLIIMRVDHIDSLLATVPVLTAVASTTISASSTGLCTGNSSRLASADCLGWQSLYDGHGGAQWNRQVVPTNARVDPCGAGEYYNIECDGSHITHIDLLEVGVTGALSDAVDALAGLSNLAVLELYGNNLTGTIPSAIGNFSNLWYLDLERNRLTGTIPSTLAHLSKLNTLYMVCNELTGTVPPLSFKQYTGDCVIASHEFDTDRGCGQDNYGPMRLACPLPANSTDCKWTSGKGGGGLDKCGGIPNNDDA